MFLMFMGGCSGSTSGGIKIIRVMIAFKAIFRTIEQTYRPNKTIITRIGSKTLNDTFIYNVLIYIVLIFTLQGASVILLLPHRTQFEFNQPLLGYSIQHLQYWPRL